MTSQSHRYMIRLFSLPFFLLITSFMTGCATYPNWLPSSGPSLEQVQGASKTQNTAGIQIVEVNDAVARKLLASQKQSLFSETFGRSSEAAYVIGAGDVIEVSIWEAPPAALFGSGAIDPRSGPAITRVTAFPEQMVNSDGAINMPFAGQIPAAGRSPHQIESEIVRRLKGKANQPQVLVRVIRNNTANVTVVGEVTTSIRMPLTARGERLLDALAAAGGVRQPVNKTTLQVTRGDQVQALPLDTIIRDPKQNIVLRSGDVVTSLFQPLSFTVLGATGKNEELNFEVQGISLAQALARAGGLQDARADAQGVFIFRFESPAALDLAGQAPTMTPEGKIPVIYRVNLKDPATFFVAQSFPIYNKDVLYVSNAPAAELQKFLNIVVSVVYPVVNVGNAVR
jgi:polysaccharide export outer membrane protein